MSKEIQKDEFKRVDEMQPLKDYLQGKSSTQTFIEKCREISKTEDIPHEVIEPKQLPSNNKEGI